MHKYTYCRHYDVLGFQEHRLAYDQTPPENVPAPEPEAPSQDQMRSVADVIRAIESTDKNKNVLQQLIETFLEDDESPAKLFEGELTQIGAQLFKLLALHRGAMEQEQMQELDTMIEGMLSHEAMMNIAFQSGLISIEAYSVIVEKKAIEKAQREQQTPQQNQGQPQVMVNIRQGQQVPSGTPSVAPQPYYQCCEPRVRTRYIREAKTMIREQMDPQSGQWIVVPGGERTIRQIQSDMRRAQTSRRADWTRRNPMMAIDQAVSRMPGLSGRQRYAIAEERKRTYFRRRRSEQWGVQTPRDSLFTATGRNYDRSPSSRYIDRTGKDKAYYSGTSTYSSYRYPSAYSPAAPGRDMAKYMNTQDRLREGYADRLTPEIAQRFMQLQETSAVNDPAFNNLYRAYKNAQSRWASNPGRRYGDLAILRSQLNAVEKRNNRNATMSERVSYLESKQKQSKRVLPAGSKFGPNDTIRITIPAEALPYSEYDKVVLYKPWTVIGMESDAHFEQLLDAGIGIKNIESQTEKNYSGSNSWNAVKAVDVFFSKPGSYYVNGSLVQVGPKYDEDNIVSPSDRPSTSTKTVSYAPEARESIEKPAMSHTVTFGSRLKYGKTYPQLLLIEQPGDDPVTIQNLRDMKVGSTQVVGEIGVTRLKENQFKIDYKTAQDYLVRGYRWRAGQYNAHDFTVEVGPGKSGVKTYEYKDATPPTSLEPEELPVQPTSIAKEAGYTVETDPEGKVVLSREILNDLEASEQKTFISAVKDVPKYIHVYADSSNQTIAKAKFGFTKAIIGTAENVFMDYRGKKLTAENIQNLHRDVIKALKMDAKAIEAQKVKAKIENEAIQKKNAEKIKKAEGDLKAISEQLNVEFYISSSLQTPTIKIPGGEDIVSLNINLNKNGEIEYTYSGNFNDLRDPKTADKRFTTTDITDVKTFISKKIQEHADFKKENARLDAEAARLKNGIVIPDNLPEGVTAFSHGQGRVQVHKEGVEAILLHPAEEPEGSGNWVPVSKERIQEAAKKLDATPSAFVEKKPPQKDVNKPKSINDYLHFGREELLPPGLSDEALQPDLISEIDRLKDSEVESLHLKVMGIIQEHGILVDWQEMLTKELKEERTQKKDEKENLPKKKA